MVNKYKQIAISLSMNFVKLSRQLFWRVFKPTTIGIRLFLVTNKKILLVKHFYLNQWFLPGGGVKSKETIREALKREIKEEVGVDLKEKIQILGIYSNFQEHKKDYIIVFLMETSEEIETTIAPRNFEIEDIRYFSFNDLPLNISPGTKRRIQEFLNRIPDKIFIEKW